MQLKLETTTLFRVQAVRIILLFSLRCFDFNKFLVSSKTCDETLCMISLVTKSLTS
jgi:hypothetical protein